MFCHLPRRALAPLACLVALGATAAEVHRLDVPGLAAPAQILVDPWGVPHLYAASSDDLYFVQGFNAARDRLFQIDLWRRRGWPAGIGFSDPISSSRTVQLSSTGRHGAPVRSYGPDAGIAARFAAGVNAYVDLLERDPARLPFEFAYFGYRPEKWQPEDVVRIRSHGLTRNLVSEFSRALITCRAGLKADEVRVRLSPRWETRAPDGLDPCIAPEVMRTYVLATQGVIVAGRDRRRGAIDDPHRLAQDTRPAPLEGSNAWAVAPWARSATGRPILASDPHRSPRHRRCATSCI
jgi:penicillin amidase